MARWFIARHGETVFNAAGRMQGEAAHTPLTRAGFAQAEEMGEALRAAARAGAEARRSGPRHRPGAADPRVVAEHLALDWHEARTDDRLAEIDVGAWGGRYYRGHHRPRWRLRRPGDRASCHLPPPGGEWL